MKNLQIHIEVSPHTYNKDPNASELGRKIVLNSIVMIDKLGFEGFTFKKLGNKIGSPESSIYRYFENKHLLLIYITYWFWSWMEYRLVFAITNIKSPSKKLKKAIAILTERVEKDGSFSHINEVLLDRIVVKEGVKTYYTIDVGSENQKGYFQVYKRIVQRVGDLILEINPGFKHPHTLVSTVIEGAHQQRFFAVHLPSLTDTNQKKNQISEFYINLVFKTIDL